MAKYRNSLPQLSDASFLTDGGLETTLIFENGFDLPEFAAFDILKHDRGFDAFWDYYRRYAKIARDHGTGFILESATWRANRDWGRKIGYSAGALSSINHKCIELLRYIRDDFDTAENPFVISGCIGPRDDGYSSAGKMTAGEAEKYHATQIKTFCETEADMVTAFTLSYADEAVGISRAAASSGIPVAIGFTLETDGRLPSGQTLGAAIEQVDRATGGAPAYYMINCVHPTHFEEVLVEREPWLERIRAVRANASKKSHAELDEAEELDAGNPVDLGGRYTGLSRQLKNLNIVGGCCGTDHRHVEEICRAVVH